MWGCSLCSYAALHCTDEEGKTNCDLCGSRQYFAPFRTLTARKGSELFRSISLILNPECAKRFEIISLHLVRFEPRVRGMVRKHFHPFRTPESSIWFKTFCYMQHFGLTHREKQRTWC